MNAEPIPWDEVRLTGWYERYDYDGSLFPHFIEKNDPLPVEHFCVVGPVGLRYMFPVHTILPPEGAKILSVPADKDPNAFAKELGGFHAIGRREHVERKSLGDLLLTTDDAPLSAVLRATIPYYCEHGRSISGTCGSCEPPTDDEDLESEHESV